MSIAQEFRLCATIYLAALFLTLDSSTGLAVAAFMSLAIAYFLTK